MVPYAQLRKMALPEGRMLSLGEKAFLFLEGEDGGLSQTLLKIWEPLGLKAEAAKPLPSLPLLPGSLPLIVVRIASRGVFVVPAKEAHNLKQALDRTELDSLSLMDLAKQTLEKEPFEIRSAKAQLVARISSAPMRRKEARRLKTGDVIPLEGEIELFTEEKIIGTAELCRIGKQKGVKWKS